MLASTVVGFVQMVGSYFVLRDARTDLFHKPIVLKGLLFGAIATAGTILPIWLFTFDGADVGIVSFLITLTIIPGTLIDWLFFG